MAVNYPEFRIPDTMTTPPIFELPNPGNHVIRGREINKYRLLKRAVAKSLGCFAYPVSEADGVHVWSILLPHLGLTYLSSPRHSRAPDAYWAVTSKLKKQQRNLIREGLRKGVLDQSLFDQGVVLGIEFESRASNAKKHFETDGADHISLVCCNENDCKSLPVPVWCLRDVLADRQSLPQTLPQPPGFGDRDLDTLSKNIKSDAQRFVLLAFLSPESRQVARGEWRLHTSALKRCVLEIALRNGHEGIRDMNMGGVLTGFTQPGLKKDLGFLRMGEQAGSKRCRGRNYYLAARYHRHLLKMAEATNVLVPEAWLQRNDS
jgi:hypothetical protein